MKKDKLTYGIIAGLLLLILVTLIILLVFVCIKNKKEPYYCGKGENPANEFSYAMKRGGVAGGGSVITQYEYPGLGWVN